MIVLIFSYYPSCVCVCQQPHEIGQLASLVEFWIDNNILLSLPEEIGMLSHLVFFEASENRLIDLPSSFGDLHCLKDLYLNDNLLSELPASFGESFFRGNNVFYSQRTKIVILHLNNYALCPYKENMTIGQTLACILHILSLCKQVVSLHLVECFFFLF